MAYALAQLLPSPPQQPSIVAFPHHLLTMYSLSLSPVAVLIGLGHSLTSLNSFSLLFK